MNSLLCREDDKDAVKRMGSAIRTVRQEYGWTLGTVARASNISVSLLSDIERGVVDKNIVDRWFRVLIDVCNDKKRTELFKVKK